MDKCKDKAGAEIKVGDGVWFDPVQGVCEIVDIQYPGVIDKDKPGRISLRVDIPFVGEPGKTTANGYTFGFLLYTRNPKEVNRVESQIDEIMKGQGKKLAHIK